MLWLGLLGGLLCLFCRFCICNEMVISVPVVVKFFVEGDELVEEWFALGIGDLLGGVREKTEFEVKFTHTMNNVQVLNVKGLDVFGERVVVGSFSSFEVLGRVRFLELCSLGDDGVYLFLFGDNIFMCFESLARFEELLEFAFDKVGFSLGVEGDVAVKDGVVGELEKEECAGVPVARLSWGVKELFDIFC